MIDSMKSFRRILGKTVLFAGLAIGLNACYYDVEENLYPDDFVPCDTSAVTYSATIAPLLQANCNSCHSAATAYGTVVLEGHSNVAVYALNGSLLGSVSHASGYSQMPKNLPKLPDCDISKILIWVNAGAPNN